MNPFSLGLLVTAFTTISLAILVWSYRPRDPIHFSFAIYSLSIGFWASFSAVQTLAASPAGVAGAVRIMHYGAVLIPALFLRFLYFLTDNLSKKALFLSYFVSLIFLLLIHNDIFIAGIEPKQPFHFFMKPGPVYFAFVVYFIAAWTYGVAHLFNEVKKSCGVKRKQYVLLLAGTLIGYCSTSAIIGHKGVKMSL